MIFCILLMNRYDYNDKTLRNLLWMENIFFSSSNSRNSSFYFVETNEMMQTGARQILSSFPNWNRIHFEWDVMDQIEIFVAPRKSDSHDGGWCWFPTVMGKWVPRTSAFRIVWWIYVFKMFKKTSIRRTVLTFPCLVQFSQHNNNFNRSHETLMITNLTVILRNQTLGAQREFMKLKTQGVNT